MNERVSFYKNFGAASQGSDYWQPIRSVLSTGREIRSDEGLMLETSALKLLLVANLRYTKLVILRPGSKVAFHMYRI